MKGILQRLYGPNILMSFNDYGKKPPVFEDATAVANAVLESGFEFDQGILLYNRFKSVVSYETTEVPIFSLDAISAAPKIHVYDSLDSEVSMADISKKQQEASEAIAFK